jgi:hypothetical protein
MHFGPWEVVAFGSLYIGSFLLATDVGLRMSPRIQKRFSFIPRLQDSGWWAFTPFIMLTAAGAIFLAKVTGFLPESGGSDASASHAAATGSFPIWATVFLVWTLLMLSPILLGRLVFRFQSAKPDQQEFIPKGALISLTEIEFNTERLSQPAPWLELYLIFANATGYEARPFNVTGRVTVSGQEFHGRIEFIDKIKSHGSEPFFEFGLKIPVSASEAQYCLDCIQGRNLSLDFTEATITFGITIYGRQGPTPEINVWLPKGVKFNAESLRTDPYLPLRSILR